MVYINFFVHQVESLLHKFNHDDFLGREFGQNTCLIAEMSAYFRDEAINYKTQNHDLEKLQYLDKFPLIKMLYLKYNCIFQSEADVERVFSFAGRFSYTHNNCAVPYVFFILFFCLWFGLYECVCVRNCVIIPIS